MVIAQHQLDHLRTRGYKPLTNRSAERFIRTLLAEWAYAQVHRTSLSRSHALLPYFGYDNTARSHLGIDELTFRQKVATRYTPEQIATPHWQAESGTPVVQPCRNRIISRVERH